MDDDHGVTWAEVVVDEPFATKALSSLKLTPILVFRYAVVERRKREGEHLILMSASDSRSNFGGIFCSTIWRGTRVIKEGCSFVV